MRRIWKLGKILSLILALVVSSIPSIAAINANQPPPFKSETEMYAYLHGVTVEEAINVKKR